MSTIESRLCRHKGSNSAVELPIVYTAMHGVGYPWIQRVFEAFNLAPPIPVAAQVTPDPTFPTVSLPNPEEGKVRRHTLCRTRCGGVSERGATWLHRGRWRWRRKPRMKWVPTSSWQATQTLTDWRSQNATRMARGTCSTETTSARCWGIGSGRSSRR